jgi:hypothetical protein
MRSILLFVVAFALPACTIIEPEGRQQTTTFTTPLTPQQTRARAEDWLADRALYEITSSEPVFVRGEKRRPRSVGPGEQIDVVSVAMASVNEGTRVVVQALTFEVAGSGARNRADQVSPEALADQGALIQVLMARP